MQHPNIRMLLLNLMQSNPQDRRRRVYRVKSRVNHTFIRSYDSSTYQSYVIRLAIGNHSSEQQIPFVFPWCHPPDTRKAQLATYVRRRKDILRNI
ncbi:hypothetical protein CYMTET_8158 [Cymbomonas tetramitiformis]|uniref:Uncharacterized protein n=1 Tax=Cymbomonas tetramitiformis TaxID=36881 RepID=A0AAE0LGR8_9CHLO|nr:hypothetical protein CYMTET_8158 [Cymbomonas tetramitiformis]